MAEDILAVDCLSVTYGKLVALKGVSLSLRSGSVASILGPNGAGKSTLLRALAGLERSRGRVTFEGENISGLPAHRIARRGLASVAQGRRLFGDLSVKDNLVLGRTRRRASQLDLVLDLFPPLARRLEVSAAWLSGGEQQMVAIGRAMMMDPKVILMDEPSLGLAPLVVDVVMESVEAIRASGVSVLLVEQKSVHAIALCDDVHVLARGSLTFSGTKQEAQLHDELLTAYLG